MIIANIAAANVAFAVQSSTVVAAARPTLVESGLMVATVRAKPDIKAEVNNMVQALRDSAFP